MVSFCPLYSCAIIVKQNHTSTHTVSPNISMIAKWDIDFIQECNIASYILDTILSKFSVYANKIVQKKAVTKLLCLCNTQCGFVPERISSFERINDSVINL